MITRKSLLVVTVVLMLAVSLSGCMAGESMAAACDAQVSNALAVEAQNAAFGAVMTGSATLNNDHVSSLITELAKANGAADLIDTVQTCFSDGKMMMNVSLANAMGGIDSVGLTGAVMVQDHMVQVQIDEASAGPFVAHGPLVELISDRINAALNDPRLGTIVDVQMGDGTLTLSMGGM